MEKIVEQGLLYDYYGELLTEHQKKIYEDAVYQDLSLSEIAEEAGISRQGVHDLIKRCDKILQDYEDKLHLVAKANAVKAKVEEIHRISAETEGSARDTETVCEDSVMRMKRIYDLSKSLMEEL